LEERVDGHAPGVDGSHTRRCHYHAALLRPLDDGAQERGLARPRLAREKDAAPRVLHEVPRLLQL